MTVIAWDGESLASDRQVTIGTSKVKSKKIGHYPQPNGFLLFGAAGSTPATELFMGWCIGKNAFPEDCVDLEGLLIHCYNNGDVTIALYETCETPLIIDNEFFAIGAGSQAAMAAMMCKKTARESVEIASKLVEGCGLGVDSISSDSLISC